MTKLTSSLVDSLVDLNAFADMEQNHVTALIDSIALWQRAMVMQKDVIGSCKLCMYARDKLHFYSQHKISYDDNYCRYCCISTITGTNCYGTPYFSPLPNNNSKSITPQDLGDYSENEYLFLEGIYSIWIHSKQYPELVLQANNVEINHADE